MIDFWGMVALGAACENMAMAVGAPWMGMWLIFWVITNVSTRVAHNQRNRNQPIDFDYYIITPSN